MLKRLRSEIDALDCEIAALLMRRLEMASVAGRLKKRVRDAGREREVLARVSGMADSPMSHHLANGIYPAIIESSRVIQSSGHVLGGYPSSSGGNGAMAVGKFDKTALPVRFDDMEFMLELCAAGCLDFAVVPLKESPLGLPKGLFIAATFARRKKTASKDCAGFSVVVPLPREPAKRAKRGRIAAKA